MEDFYLLDLGVQKLTNPIRLLKTIIIYTCIYIYIYIYLNLILYAAFSLKKYLQMCCLLHRIEQKPKQRHEDIRLASQEHGNCVFYPVLLFSSTFLNFHNQPYKKILCDSHNIKMIEYIYTYCIIYISKNYG